jgi:hypothetical protein
VIALSLHDEEATARELGDVVMEWGDVHDAGVLGPA